MTTSTLPLPMDAPPLRWGIIGTGSIAHKFAEAVTFRTRSSVVAVGSRDRARAELFAAAFDVPTWFGSYTELVQEPMVDAVYVASPHSHHREHAELAIAGGKHVLIEKPLAVTAEDGRRVARAAAVAGVFAMEGMWAAFLPHRRALTEAIVGGDLGEIVHVAAHYAHHFAFDPRHRIFAPELAGGALLDLGVYPLALAGGILGRPSRILALGDFAATGVDEQVSIVLGYPSGAQATISASSRGLGPKSAHVLGTEARVELEHPFGVPATFVLTDRAGARRSYEAPVENGMEYEIAEFARGVDAGERQSVVVPLEDSIRVLDVMDEVRAQIGLGYPFLDPPA
jgi:predicted dehydrogenase